MKTKTLELQKFDYRGGTRFKKKLTTATSILLRYLWVKAGGVQALGKKFKVPSQFFVNWQRDGKVPLKKAGMIARGLNVSIYALNYSGSFELNGDGPSFKEVVGAYVTEPEVQAAIFKSKQPVHAKGTPL